ncbi:MAG: hypothetical protein P8J87_14375 [Verrucomicrobiales bacterium]|nr:hypothetical protein [Verrucomicrobiales bacterium]
MPKQYNNKYARHLLDILFEQITTLGNATLPHSATTPSDQDPFNCEIVDCPSGGACEIIQSADGLVQAWIEYRPDSPGLRTQYRPTVAANLAVSDEPHGTEYTDTRTAAKAFLLAQFHRQLEHHAERIKWAHARSFAEVTFNRDRSHSLHSPEI